jgi:hypothetical protein
MHRACLVQEHAAALTPPAAVWDRGLKVAGLLRVFRVEDNLSRAAHCRIPAARRPLGTLLVLGSCNPVGYIPRSFTFYGTRIRRTRSAGSRAASRAAVTVVANMAAPIASSAGASPNCPVIHPKNEMPAIAAAMAPIV